jgi:hypothetical protein
MRALILVVAILVGTGAFAQLPTGSYSGSPKAELDKNGRTLTLLEDFSYTDPQGRAWVAPKGSVVDGASIPTWAWPIIGGPLEGKYRDSSVIHDVACIKHWAQWETVHEVFYWGMLASGVEEWRAKVMFTAVYHFGPRWPRTVIVTGLPASQTPVAQQRALEGAADGSQASVVAVTQPSPLSADQAATFQILVAPPTNTMSKDQFDALAKQIESDAKSGKPTPTLEQLKSAHR